MRRPEKQSSTHISAVQVLEDGTEPIRGWLIVYLVVLAGLAAHGLELTVASLIIGANPSLAGLTSFVPAPALAFYVVSNTLLILYAALLFTLMLRRKRVAIAHNVVYNVLSIFFLLGWHAFNMKSTLGVAIDAAPNLLMTAYILRSKRVRRTFRGSVGPEKRLTLRGAGAPVDAGEDGP
ncbi:hypothetical protein ACPCHT_23275 [Nucisporomicrobium flavum]|uniref:hypothetical protein n=1 Tax=Nucisporomicrobium flavum TaxID=2785915 RepID=UPI003C2F6DC2